MLPQQKKNFVENAKVTLQVAPEFLRKLQTLPTQSVMDPIQYKAMNTTQSHLYLGYKPTSPIKCHNKDHFFDILGFKPASASERMRTAFIADMANHVQSSSYQFLNRAANPEAFQNVVSEFLAEYGPIYWGDSEREHLEESDVLKGFLCPRDALRPRSGLVAVVEGFFNYKAYNVRKRSRHSDIDFAALTGRKADLIPPPKTTKSATPVPRRQKRRRVVLESEEPTKPTFLAELGENSKRACLSQSSRGRELSQDMEAHGPSRAPNPHRPTSAPISLTETNRPSTDTLTISDESDNNLAKPGNRVSKNTNIGPDATAQRIKDEPLSPDITSRIKLRVKADGPGVKARGPITVGFEVYKTSERIFTSLMSERSLKPEMQKKVSQLTVTINGKETCCRRNRFDDWTEVCREIHKLWESNPELFSDRLEVDVMLHVDE